MIPQRDLSWQTQSWQEQMVNAVRSPSELLALLELRPEQVSLSMAANEKFPLLTPRAFVSRMQKGNPNDPLLLQVLNSQSEDYSPTGYGADPLDESSYNPVPGLIRKYENRALLIVTGKCAIHCRYCFRRAFPYNQNNPGKQNWSEAFDYLANNPEIEEIILSGGDPLAAPDKHLKWLIENLSKLSHLKRLRIHTRLPIVIPDRVTEQLLQILKDCPMTTSMVIHANHANEFSPSLNFSIRKLKSAADFVLNQSVLLKGINDQLEAQIELQNACIDSGVLPYYLHFLDPIEGASHFEVLKEDALKLYQRMQARLSGYMLPKLVIETPGTASKQFLR